MNIRNCLNKRIVYTTLSSVVYFEEGVVQQLTPTAVNISGLWLDIEKIVVKEVLGNNINESGNCGETLING